MTLLADVVAASSEVSGTSSRSAKIATLAKLLRKLEPAEIAVVVGFLSGAPRQGRVGIGWSMSYGVESSPAAEPTLTVSDIDVAIGEIQDSTGAGSNTRRKEILGDL